MLIKAYLYEKYKEGEGSDLSLSVTECSPILITYKCVMHCSLKVSQLDVVQASQVLSDIWLKKCHNERLYFQILYICSLEM